MPPALKSRTRYDGDSMQLRTMLLQHAKKASALKDFSTLKKSQKQAELLKHRLLLCDLRDMGQGKAFTQKQMRVALLAMATDDKTEIEGLKPEECEQWSMVTGERIRVMLRFLSQAEVKRTKAPWLALVSDARTSDDKKDGKDDGKDAANKKPSDPAEQDNEDEAEDEEEEESDVEEENHKGEDFDLASDVDALASDDEEGILAALDVKESEDEKKQSEDEKKTRSSRSTSSATAASRRRHGEL